MRRWILRALVLALLIAAGWWLRARFFASPPLEVEVVELRRGPVEATVTNSRAGTVVARKRAKMSPEIGGTVVELPFAEGQAVEAGDVLLRLDDRLQRARLLVAERQRATAEAERARTCLTAERAARERERIAGLAESGIVSADQLDSVQSAARTAGAACTTTEAGVASARAAVALARAELDKTVLRAPFAGVIAELATELGEYVTPSPPAVPVPPAVDVLDPASIYVRAPMDEVDSARIRAGQVVRVTVDSHREETFAGHVARVAPYVLDREQQNRTVDIEVDFDDPSVVGDLLPGTSADVEVVLEVREGVLRVPASSLIEGRRLLLLEGEALRAVEVEVGLRNWDWIEVSGIEEGALVVAAVDREELVDGAAAVRAGTP